MSRTDLDPASLAKSLRGMAGDGGMEWVTEPMRASVLLDVADMLDENAKLREQIHWLKKGDILHVLTDQEYIDQCERERLMQVSIDALDKENAKLRELVRELLDLCYDAYNQEWGWDDDWSLAYERAKKLGVEVRK